MPFPGQFTNLNLLLHCRSKLQHRVVLPYRHFTRQGKNVPSLKLSWDSLTPDKAINVDEAVDAVVQASNDHARDAEANAAATKALAAAAVDAQSRRHLSLTPEDVKFLRSGLSPLGLLGSAEAAAASPSAGKRPPGCPHWGHVSEPAARPDQSVAPPAEGLNPTYAACAQRDWARVFLRPPVSPWQELQQLTAEGKLWHYPIDNEQGRELEPEGRVSFQRHVMLDRQLQDWVPKTGPVRHFMETVCVGLSKNPYLSAAEKADHLDWYRRYFADKLDDIKAAYEQSVGGKQPISP